MDLAAVPADGWTAGAGAGASRRVFEKCCAIPETANLPDYLAPKNVICADGSWITPANLMAKGDWAAIRDLAGKVAS